MPDEFREILRRELDELKQNKIRVIALGVCFIVLLFFWITDDGANEEEILITESPPAPVTKDLPVKNLPVAKTLEGVKVVLGANADGLFISDPFAGEENPYRTNSADCDSAANTTADGKNYPNGHGD